MPYTGAGDGGSHEKFLDRVRTKNAAFRTAARVIRWLMLIFIAVSAVVELMRGMGY